MTKPVAVFRSGVMGDSRHTVRLDENSHLVLFPSFSRYITSWPISATDGRFRFFFVAFLSSTYRETPKNTHTKIDNGKIRRTTP
jgi:hypothetical protein